MLNINNKLYTLVKILTDTRRYSKTIVEQFKFKLPIGTFIEYILTRIILTFEFLSTVFKIHPCISPV